MSVLAAAAAGVLTVVGLIVAWRAIRPTPPSLAYVLAGLERRGTAITETPPASAWRASVGESTLALLDASGLVYTARLKRRLRILDHTTEEHAFRKVTSAAIGLAIPLAIAGLVAVAGVVPSPGWATAAAVVGGVAGFSFPDLGLADRVEARRRGFRHALSAYLDLVTVILAGAGGLETALHTAAEAGDGWAFAEIRGCLRRSRLTGRTPWEGFDRLGSELGIDELRELAASAELAGDHGARIRASLAAKADSLRAHQIAALEAQAESATEKMLLPVIGLVVGMILFIGYGVVEAISTPTITPTP